MAMPSNASDETKKGRIEYTECYKVIYSPGELKKAGNRVWQDGLVTYYTINQRLVLRDDRGHLIDETFYATLPKATLRLIKEEGQRAATIPIGIPFQINDSFTIEVENVKFIRDKFFEDGGMRESTPQQRRSRPMPDVFKDVEDILARSSATATAVGPSEKELFRGAGQKRKAESLNNLDTNTTPARRRISTGDIDSPSPLGTKMVLPTPTRPFRAVGLSRTPRRSGP